MMTSSRSLRTRCGTTKRRGKAPCSNGRMTGMTTMSLTTSPCSSRRRSRRTGVDLKHGKTETRLTGGTLARNYIPRDEVFDQVKRSGILENFIKGHKAVADLFNLDKSEFRDFDEIRCMYALVGEESNLETVVGHQAKPFEFLRNFTFTSGDTKNTFKYPTPRIIAVDKNAWSKDVEFAHQALAGMNPLLIEILKEFPLKRASTVSAEIVEKFSLIEKFSLSISKALKNKRLFVLNYHDRFMGYIQRINKQKNSQKPVKRMPRGHSSSSPRPAS